MSILYIYISLQGNGQISYSDFCIFSEAFTNSKSPDNKYSFGKLSDVTLHIIIILKMLNYINIHFHFLTTLNYLSLQYHWFQFIIFEITAFVFYTISFINYKFSECAVEKEYFQFFMLMSINYFYKICDLINYIYICARVQGEKKTNNYNVLNACLIGIRVSDTHKRPMYCELLQCKHARIINMLNVL